MTEKRSKVAVYDDKAINGFTVLDLQKPNSLKRLKYENVYIGSKAGCEIVCNFGNSLAEENEQLKSENDSYKNMFFEIVETALTDTNCKELYCKGILDIFDKANSLNQAREMIKEHLK